MILATLKLRGISINHPLGKSPDQLPEDELLELTRRLRAGDESTHEAINASHTKIAISLASKYARLAPHLADELVSEALFGVIYAIKAAREKLVDDSITPWITSNVHRFLHRFLSRNARTVTVPYSTLWRRRAAGQTVNIPMPRDLPESLVDRQSSMFELHDMLEQAARTQLDRTILSLRGIGKCDREIAEGLGVTKSYITRKRSELRARFERLENS